MLNRNGKVVTTAAVHPLVNGRAHDTENCQRRDCALRIGSTQSATLRERVLQRFSPPEAALIAQPAQQRRRRDGARLTRRARRIDLLDPTGLKCSPHGHEIALVGRPLDQQARPLLTDVTSGRFVACAPRFYDPAVYAAGRDITVVGTVADPSAGRIGERAYIFPRVAADGVYLWPQRPPQVVYYPVGGWPYWYDPFWPMWPWW